LISQNGDEQVPFRPVFLAVINGTRSIVFGIDFAIISMRSRAVATA